jgi:polar amino acid transport system substrate-binding protein
MGAVVQRAATWLAHLIATTTKHFSVTCSPDLPSIVGNRRRLEQVMVNLIQNACQALPDPDRAVRVTLARQDSVVVVEVADEGGGIPEEALKHITDPFFTTKRAVGGTGLGLSIASSIVREHGGTLEFISEQGKGATVRVSLPLPESTQPRVN